MGLPFSLYFHRPWVGDGIPTFSFSGIALRGSPSGGRPPGVPAVGDGSSYLSLFHRPWVGDGSSYLFSLLFLPWVGDGIPSFLPLGWGWDSYLPLNYSAYSIPYLLCRSGIGPRLATYL